ncbi:MAG: cellulose synthase operon protein YhjQ/BcsQ [Acidimicrobiales bacterium]
MRVLLLGKGGSGKSTLAGLLATTLSGGGDRVLALDADSVPGLAQVLGMDPSDDWFLAGMAVREHGGWQLSSSPRETVERGARVAPGGVRFLQSGNADASMKEFELTRQRFPDRWSGQVAFNTIIRSYDDEGGWVIVDLHGGTLQVAAGMAGQSGVAVVVVEPFAKSVLTARRFVEMGEWPGGLRLVAVANKVADHDDEAYLEAELAAIGIPLWATIPTDPAVARAERAGQPLVTLDADTPARRSVTALADRLRRAAADAPVAAVP